MTEVISQDRTKNYIRQVKGSAIFKGLAIAASFFSVPLMIHYLGSEQYGIWSTLLSIMSWVVLFDLGIGNGLRNKLAESLAKNQVSEAAGYISSGYTWIGAISLLTFVLIFILAFLMPWQKIFNTLIISNNTLRNAIIVSAFFILINFWLSLINQILNAVQETSSVVVGQFISNALGLMIVFILNQATKTSLLYLVVAYGGSMMIANLLLSRWFYKKHIELMPQISFKKQHIQPLLSVGMQFFVIQIAVIIIFTTDKILITQMFGPQYVTQYDVAFKLFSVISILHSLLTAPLWSAYTDAYHRADFEWIRAILRKQLIIFIGIIGLTISFVLMAKTIIDLWVGNDVKVSLWLLVSMGTFIIVSTWNNIFSYLLNGVGAIRVQLFTAIIAMMANIPLAILFVKFFHFGIQGIVWATCLSLSIFAIAGPLQVISILAVKKPVLPGGDSL